tara:strand:+ start:331 stop:534 length:204 start_codon:yes stop_codon:yes gene_type:complete
MQKINTPEGFYALAIDKFHRNQYPEAIEAFHQSLALKENWQSFQGLGWTLINTKQYELAIEAFKINI